MPGTLLPPELLGELTDVAGAIVAEVLASNGGAALPSDRSEPWAYIVEHSIDAAVVGLGIGRRLLPEDELSDLGIGLFVQDIGMLALPERVVQKPGPLAPDEWDLMMRHPLLGLEFLRGDSIPARARTIVRSHHERWDGSGYPGALVGEEISLFARVAAVADVFDAVTSERWHAPAVPPRQGVEIIRSGAGSAFDPAVVEAFLDSLPQ